jgi:hypothetical protein
MIDKLCGTHLRHWLELHYGIECPPYKLFQVTKALSQVIDGW